VHRLLALVSLLGASCSTLTVELGEELDMQSCTSFEPGKTRRADVLASLGPPLRIGKHGHGVALLYEYLHLTENQLGPSLKSLGTILHIPEMGLLKLALGDSDSRRNAALYLFDGEGVLLAQAFDKWGEDYGRGGSLQMILSIEEIVDSGGVRAPPLGLTWGRDLLRPLPQTLNLHNRPDVELGGTGRTAGQHALEQTRHGSGGNR